MWPIILYCASAGFEGKGQSFQFFPAYRHGHMNMRDASLTEHGARKEMELTKNLSRRKLLRLNATSMSLPSETAEE
jgi:hypothetical protein